MRFVTLTGLLLLSVSSAVEAQEKPLAVTTGFGAVNSSGGSGVHGSATVEYQLPVRPLQIRVEGVVQRALLTDIFSFASLQVRPLRNRVFEPYGFAGVGAFFDNGPQRAAMLGVGADIPALRLPIFVAYKYIDGREGYRLLSVGLRFRRWRLGPARRRHREPSPNFALTLRDAFGAACPSGHAAPARVAACGGSPHLRGAS